MSTAVRPTPGPIPLRTVVPCPACGAVGEITLLVDETMLPAIPVRVVDMPTRCADLGCGGRFLGFAAEDRAELQQAADRVIARVAQHMLWRHADITAPRAPLSLFSVRRTLQAAFGGAVTIPANSRIRHREEDH